MNRNSASRLIALHVAAVATVGVVAVSVLSSSQGAQSDLADYGASVTAHSSMAHARSAGVPHQHNGGHQ
jgi:hypothetical protein